MIRALLAAAALGLAGAASAATYTVAKTTDDTDTSNQSNLSLRAALILANQNPGADTIILPAGTYTLTIPGAGENASATGDLDILGDVTIVGSGGNAEGDPAATVIEAGPTLGDRVMQTAFDSDFNVSLKALTVRNGKTVYSQSEYGSGFGGGIFISLDYTGSFEIYNCVIEGNSALGIDASGRNRGVGGGIYADSELDPAVTTAKLRVEKTIVRNNQAASYGGGINTAYYLTQEYLDSSIEGNTVGNAGASSDSYMGGGGLNLNQMGNDGQSNYLHMRNVTIANNTSFGSGGGMALSGKTVRVDHVTVSGNVARGQGGAAGDGGGIYWSGNAVADLRHLTITNNRANADGTGGGLGGGIALNTSDPDGDLTLHNSIIVGNFAGTGSTADDLNRWFNTPANDPSAQGLNAASAGNLVGAGGSANAVKLNAAANQLNVSAAAARLAPLADNGGIGQTHALLAGSPALDAGVNALVPTGVTTDQRGAGFPRILDAGDADPTATVDVGALEMFPVVQAVGNVGGVGKNAPAQGLIRVGGSGAGYAPFDAMTFTAASSDQSIVSDASLSVTGTGRQRQVNATTRGLTGTATITVTASAVVNGKTLTSSDSFTITVVTDATPDAFAFTPKTQMLPGVTILSDPITVTGIDTPVSIGIGATPGEYGYYVNGSEACRYDSGMLIACPVNTVNDGDQVRVFHTTSSSYGATVTSTLTIGGVQGSFSSTTDSPPNPPTGVTATPGDGSLAVSWTASAANGGTLDRYTVLVRQGGSGAGSCDATPPATGCAVSGLTNGTQYDVTVLAYNQIATSGVASSTVQATPMPPPDSTPDPFAFTAQTNVAPGAQVESNAITVAGINMPAAISVAGGQYQVNGGAWTASAASVNAGDAVKVRHTASASPATATTTVLTIGGVQGSFQSTTMGLPDAPTGVSATPGDASARIEWAAPASDGGGAITGYTVTADGGATACAASPCTVTGLGNGTLHTFAVHASNAAGDGPSAQATATPATLGDPAVALPGGGTAAVAIGGNPPGCVLSAPITIDGNLPPGAPTAAAAPLGVLRFAASGCAGATLAVQVDYPAGRLSGLHAWKYGPPAAGQAAGWFAHGSINGDRVTYTVQDDGAGDNDTATPGAIADPFVPLALPAGAAAIPTLSLWGLLLLSALLGLAVPRRKVSSKKCL